MDSNLATNFRMKDDALVQVRMKYAEDLEEIIQCPVCFEKPMGTIPTCRQGHHICQNCRSKMNQCPTCQNTFGGSRNYVAENLSVKFEDIVNSLLRPEHHLNKRVLENKRTIGTQTEDKNIKKAICKIGFCQYFTESEHMYHHVKHSHKVYLIEINNPLCGRAFGNLWNLEYSLSKLYSYGIKIKDIGFVFFNIFIDEEGNLLGNTHVVHCEGYKQQFTCCMMISNEDEYLPFTILKLVNSVDDKFIFTGSFGKHLFKNYFKDNMISLTNDRKKFYCFLIVIAN